MSKNLQRRGKTGRRGLRRGRLFALAIVLLASCAVAGVWAASQWVWGAAEGRVFDRVEQVPSTKVGLVLGCPPTVRNGGDNLYFVARVQAAASLFHSGKVEYLLVSGDNAESSYNEPKAMAEALAARGVPASRVVEDYAGFRTLDSLARAQKVFGLDELTVVSQEFQNRRALFIAQGLGIEAHGFNAEDVERGLLERMRWREMAARIMAFADVYLLDTEPKVLGDPIVIGEARGEGKDEEVVGVD